MFALKGHTREVMWLAFGPDGKTLASCGKEGTARVWDLAGDRPQRLSSTPLPRPKPAAR
jgi:WD40 repeat protein